MSERWLPVVGYEGLYEVSDHGKVRSVTRGVRGVHESVRVVQGRELVPWTTGETRHLTVSLWKNNRDRRIRVHRLVLEAFFGPCPPGMVGCHTDDDAQNNRLENLRWDTESENAYDRIRNGIHHNVNKTHCPHGHEYTPENTIFYTPRAGRLCRTCNRIRELRRRAEDRTIYRTVPCPQCGAKVNDWCRVPSGGAVLEHSARRRLAQKESA